MPRRLSGVREGALAGRLQEQLRHLLEALSAKVTERDLIAHRPPQGAVSSNRGTDENFGGQFALNGVSFDLHRGEVLGLIGPNGAGKTTLLETIAGILPADDGRITSDGKDIPQHRRRQTLFYVPDGVRPYGEQYVMQVLSFMADVFRRSAKDVEQTVAAAGLREVLGKRVNSLSKGSAGVCCWRSAFWRRSPCCSWMSHSTASTSDKPGT